VSEIRTLYVPIGNRRRTDMRIWMILPKTRCDQHLLSECELHKFIVTLQMYTHIDSYIRNDLLESLSIHSRHKTIGEELERRSIYHKTSLEFSETVTVWLHKEYKLHIIDRVDVCSQNLSKNVKEIILSFLVEQERRNYA